jgi:hypothetical protein
MVQARSEPRRHCPLRFLLMRPSTGVSFMSDQGFYLNQHSSFYQTSRSSEAQSISEFSLRYLAPRLNAIIHQRRQSGRAHTRLLLYDISDGPFSFSGIKRTYYPSFSYSGTGRFQNAATHGAGNSYPVCYSPSHTPTRWRIDLSIRKSGTAKVCTTFSR